MKSVLRVLAAVILVVSLAFPVLAAGPNGHAAKPTAAASSMPSGAPAASPAEAHPQIRAALVALRDARVHLEHAAHDFGGHRVEAIKATDEAIRQLEICLKYDKD